jgi:HSP20 family protein
MLTRWSPFSLFREMDDVFNRFFEDAWRQSRGDQGDVMSTWWPAVESYSQDGTLYFRLALPGVDPKDVEVSVTDETLTIRGARRATGEGQQGSFFHRELAYGRFERSFAIPDGVDASKVSAKYANGMLEISMPAPQLAAPRKVEIQTEGQAPERKQIRAA